MTSVRLRTAHPDDAEEVAALHADSWRRHYRGAYADSFLDGDVDGVLLAVWTERLAERVERMTVLAEDAAGLAGFVHVVFDADERWGSLLDNLHVAYDRKRTGIGATLLTRAAEGVAEYAGGRQMYLWVLAQNTAAQAFYRSLGGTVAEESTVPGPPERLNGTPACFRVVWPDVTSVAASSSMR